MNRAAVAVGLLLGLLLVVAVRSVGFEQVFPREAGAPSLVLPIDDAQYHARRAEFSFARFPSVLSFDRYLNAPRGAAVPWPPLYDFALAAAGRALGSEAGSLERVLGWAPVALALATAIAVFALGRRIGGDGVALGSLLLFALLPASTSYSSVGNPDHHAVVACVASVLLLGHVASLSAGSAGDRMERIWRWQAVLVAARVTMLLTWHGSILYLVLGDALALVVAAAFSRRELLVAQSAGCVLAAGLGALSLRMPHSAFAGDWSVFELSRLQPVTLLAMGVAAGALAAFQCRREGGGKGWASTPVRRGLVAGIVLWGVAVPVAVLARDSLAPAFDYATRAERFIEFNYESQPLWRSLDLALSLYGYVALLLPLAPFAGWLAARTGRAREAALLLAGWTAVLVALAVSNARYSSDLAPALSVAFALLVAAGAREAAKRWRLAKPAVPVAVLVLVLALLADPLLALAPHAERSLAALQGHERVVYRPGLPLGRSVYAFAEAVRAATPETAGYLDPEAMPEYSILTPPTLGLAVNRLARRPTPAGNFGPYVGREGIEATNRFYLAPSEAAGLREARAVGARYVITSDEGVPSSTLLHRLHQDDGTRVARQELQHFRLVTEAPARGVPLGALRGAAPDFVDAPYKLFELVKGAVLVVPSVSGERVFAQVEIETPTGRRFVWQSGTRVGASGIARLRVPYATDGATAARATGPYTVRAWRSGARVEVRVSVSDRDVVGGGEVPVRLDGA